MMLKSFAARKAAKLSLFIYARNRIRMSAKRTKYFAHCLRKSMKGAASVDDAVALGRVEILRLWTLNRFRTMKLFCLCKLKVDDYWLRGAFPLPLLHLKEDPAFRKRFLIYYFHSVAKEEDATAVRRMLDAFIPVFLVNIVKCMFE